MKQLKTWFALVLLGLLIIFAVQNMAIIQVNFLGFGFETRRIVMIVIALGVGFILGKFVKFRHH